MKVTLFTSNNHRHNYLINLLSNFCDELWVVQECKTLFTGKNDEKYENKNIIQEYFIKVLEAQNKIFKKEFVNKNNKNIKTLPILYGEINKLPLSYLDDFLKSDIYIVFGSSFIKGELVDFLVKQKAINIHAGVSPYYRGTDCNFWALYDDNPQNKITWSSFFIFRPQKQMPEQDWIDISKSAELLTVGIESLNQDVRFHMGKKFTNKDMHYCFDMCMKYNIKVTSSF